MMTRNKKPPSIAIRAFHFNVMLFGITDAPATPRRWMSSSCQVQCIMPRSWLRLGTVGSASQSSKTPWAFPGSFGGQGQKISKAEKEIKYNEHGLSFYKMPHFKGCRCKEWHFPCQRKEVEPCWGGEEGTAARFLGMLRDWNQQGMFCPLQPD